MTHYTPKPSHSEGVRKPAQLSAATLKQLMNEATNPTTRNWLERDFRIAQQREADEKAREFERLLDARK